MSLILIRHHYGIIVGLFCVSLFFIKHLYYFQYSSQRYISTASSFLEEICPDATTGEIEAALSASGGDANQAADTLLGK